MVGATIFEFCKGLFDRESLIIERVLYIWVALTSERLVSRFFHFKLLSFTSTSTNLMSYDIYMINPLIILLKRVPATQTLEFQGSSGTGRLLLVKGAGYLKKLKRFSNGPPHFILAF